MLVDPGSGTIRGVQKAVIPPYPPRYYAGIPLLPPWQGSSLLSMVPPPSMVGGLSSQHGPPILAWQGGSLLSMVLSSSHGREALFPPWYPGYLHREAYPLSVPGVHTQGGMYAQSVSPTMGDWHLSAQQGVSPHGRLAPLCAIGLLSSKGDWHLSAQQASLSSSWETGTSLRRSLFSSLRSLPPLCAEASFSLPCYS